MWWHTSVIPAIRMLRQEHCEFKSSLDHIARQSKERDPPNHTQYLKQKVIRYIKWKYEKHANFLKIRGVV
jgi:hypothetical protein